LIDIAEQDVPSALDDAVALCASLSHELIEVDLPALTPGSLSPGARSLLGPGAELLPTSLP
jgi:hypothetical protein